MKYETIEQLLGVQAPWSVQQLHVDEERRRVEVRIAYGRSGWLGGLGRLAGNANPRYSWQHLNLGQLSCRVHLSQPVGMPIPETPWSGGADSPFSRALGNLLLMLLGSGASMTAISSSLRLDPQDLWRFKHGVDIGRMGAGGGPRPLDVPMPDMAVPDAGNDALPPAEHPLWHQLLGGTEAMEFRNLGLQLLLTRLRSQYQLAADDQVRALKAQELRRYCEKNWRNASRELERLRGAR